MVDSLLVELSGKAPFLCFSFCPCDFREVELVLVDLFNRASELASVFVDESLPFPKTRVVRMSSDFPRLSCDAGVDDREP